MKSLPLLSTKYNKITLIISASIALLTAYLISYLMLKGVAAPHNFRHVILLVFFIVFCSSSKKLFWYIIFPMTLIYAIYLPIGMTYGSFNYNFLIAGISTDPLEAGEFLHQIPYKNFLYSIIVIITIMFYRFIVKYFDLRFYRNQTFMFISLLIMLASQSPAIFPKQIKASIYKLYDEYQKMEAFRQPSEWKEANLTAHYDTYILIIGESARKDYHHAYGYPIDNTPFMSQANGILVDGLTSGGTSTVPSLKAMLTFSQNKNWDADYRFTFIDLVKKAGLKTYWLSNQGYLGTFDTPISALAKSNDYTYFLKYGTYDSKNTSDFELLPKLSDIVSSNTKQKKLIVLHLYGSHPNACDRITDYHLITSVNNGYYSYLNCYISSIHKTDAFIEKVYQIMESLYKEKHETFSILYFADHGQAHREINNKMYFNNNQASKLHYEIPLFVISSDSTNRTVCQSFKSGLNFTNGLANWIGITNQFLDSKYSLFNCINDPNDYGLSKRIQNIELEPDYAIDLRNK